MLQALTLNLCNTYFLCSFKHIIFTFSGGMSGSYLYLPTAYLKMGDRVRLFSPEYDLRSNESLSHCFTFWYHMKSRSVGELNIYINDELRWTIAGEQGSDWNEGFVPLPNDFVHVSSACFILNILCIFFSFVRITFSF